MNPSAFTGAAIAIGTFLLSHLALAIWFASKINTKVTEMTDTIKEMAGELKTLAQIDKRLAVLEERMSRTEQDLREVLKAAAVLGRSVNDPPAR